MQRIETSLVRMFLLFNSYLIKLFINSLVRTISSFLALSMYWAVRKHEEVGEETNAEMP
jgi:hypothetical protein